MWSPTSSQLYDLLQKSIRVIAVDKSEYSGWAYAIDPISTTVALIDFPTKTDDKDDATVSNLLLIPGTSIVDVIEISTDHRCPDEVKKSIDRLVDRNGTDASNSDQSGDDAKSISDRKSRLVRWLEANRIPMDPDDGNDRSIKVMNSLEIRRPYRLDDILCSNQVILSRIRKILEAMPQDF